jgi:hypothetical protein
LLGHHLIHEELTNAEDVLIIIAEIHLDRGGLSFSQFTREQVISITYFRLPKVGVYYSNYLSRERVGGLSLLEAFVLYLI